MALVRTRIAAASLALIGASAAFAAVGDDVGIDFRKNITLSPQETQAQAKDYYKKMQETQRRVTQARATAAEERPCGAVHPARSYCSPPSQRPTG